MLTEEVLRNVTVLGWSRCCIGLSRWRLLIVIYLSSAGRAVLSTLSLSGRIICVGALFLFKLEISERAGLLSLEDFFNLGDTIEFLLDGGCDVVFVISDDSIEFLFEIEDEDDDVDARLEDE